MSTFITTLDARGDGPRLAVKDIIDVLEVPTTAGCRAVEKTASPAAADAACLAGARAAGARIVGKANLHELAMLPVGTNPWFGTPVNPLDPALIPGGSSSGSAVAVAAGEADVAYGSDTGGSIRVPAACCGVSGLKTTYGRVSLAGVWPLAPSLDTIGPMAATIGGVLLGMQLLEPGFTPAPSPATTIGRIRTDSDPRIEAAIDAALAQTEVTVVDIPWEEVAPGVDIFGNIYFSEVWTTDHRIAEEHPDDVGDDIKLALQLAPQFVTDVDGARARLAEWQRSLRLLFDRVQLLALPTMPVFPPRLDALQPATFFPTLLDITRHVSLFNPAGVPCLAQPVRSRDSAVPPSLQLVGPPGAEELLVATASRVEEAAGPE